MNPDAREREARTALIAALARSQFAVARILECVGDMARHDPGMAASLKRNYKSLAALQRSLTGAVKTLERHPAKRKRGTTAIRKGNKPKLVVPGKKQPGAEARRR